MPMSPLRATVPLYDTLYSLWSYISYTAICPLCGTMSPLRPSATSAALLTTRIIEPTSLLVHTDFLWQCSQFLLGWTVQRFQVMQLKECILRVFVNVKRGEICYLKCVLFEFEVHLVLYLITNGANRLLQVGVCTIPAGGGALAFCSTPGLLVNREHWLGKVHTWLRLAQLWMRWCTFTKYAEWENLQQMFFTVPNICRMK
jgi:hypothetical protein